MMAKRTAPLTRGPAPTPGAVGHLTQAQRDKRALIVLPDRAPSRAPSPAVPPGLTKSAQSLWRRFWRSPVAGAINPDADRYLLVRWIQAVNEREITYPLLIAARLVKGSTGQLVLSPLARYLNQLEVTIAWCETQMGMTPAARARLGIALGVEALTAAELNRQLDASVARPTREPEAWESDWIEA